MITYASFRKMFLEKTEPKYVAIKPDLTSIENIVEFCEVIGLSSSLMLPEKSLHCTIAYSRAPIADPTSLIKETLPVEGIGDELDIFGHDGERALVLKISSVSIRALHVSLKKEFGISHDYPTFRPHVSLCYDLPKDFKVPSMKGKEVELRFTDFQVKMLDPD